MLSRSGTGNHGSEIWENGSTGVFSGERRGTPKKTRRSLKTLISDGSMQIISDQIRGSNHPTTPKKEGVSSQI